MDRKPWALRARAYNLFTRVFKWFLWGRASASVPVRGVIKLKPIIGEIKRDEIIAIWTAAYASYFSKTRDAGFAIYVANEAVRKLLEVQKS